MKNIILLRHGQSLWNVENRFTGWTDVPLTDKGREEARQAGIAIRQAGLKPEFYFTSFLRRAIDTQQIVADTIDRMWIPVIKDWHLNERHYGALQGLDKADTARKFGEEQVREWRRSFDAMPPLLTPDDPRFPGNDPKYADLSRDELPLSESLQNAIARVRCCWEEIIVPRLRFCDTVLITAHGNSLRGLAKMLLHMTASEIVDIEIPTGTPWLFIANDRLEVTDRYFLTDHK